MNSLEQQLVDHSGHKSCWLWLKFQVKPDCVDWFWSGWRAESQRFSWDQWQVSGVTKAWVHWTVKTAVSR